MTIDSLVNFGVPGISNNRVAPMQPLLRHKFRVMFKNFGKDIETHALTQQVRGVTLPEVIHNKIPPLPTTIEFYDDITTKAMGLILSQCDRQRCFNEVDSYFQMRIELITGSTPDILRTYEYINCLIHSVKSDRLDYSDSEALQYRVEISHSTFYIYDAEMKRLW